MRAAESEMERDIAEIVLDQDRIHARVREMGIEIAEIYRDLSGPLTIVPILSGAIIFLADLMRELPLKMKIALVHVSAYPGKSTSARDPETKLALTADLRDRHVLLVDDVLDSGKTLRRVQGMVRELAPASLRTAVLLRKPAKAPADITVDFVGFDIDDLFVVGYGLDYDDLYRNFPHIGLLRPELME